MRVWGIRRPISQIFGIKLWYSMPNIICSINSVKIYKIQDDLYLQYKVNQKYEKLIWYLRDKFIIELLFDLRDWGIIEPLLSIFVITTKKDDI